MSFFKDAFKTVRSSLTSRPSDSSQPRESNINDRSTLTSRASINDRESVIGRESAIGRESLAGRNSIFSGGSTRSLARETSARAVVPWSSTAKPLKSAMKNQSQKSPLSSGEVHVNWKKKVGVVLVPSLAECLESGCDLWWSTSELDDTRRDFQLEICSEMSVDPSLRSVKEAIIKLCRIPGTIAYIDPSSPAYTASDSSSIGSNPLELNVEARGRSNSLSRSPSAGTNAPAEHTGTTVASGVVSQDMRGIPSVKPTSGVETSIESCEECGASYDKSIYRDCPECAKRSYYP